MTIYFKKLLTTLAAATMPALAHDLYLMPEKFVAQSGKQLRLVFQNGDEFPIGVSSVKPEKLSNTKLMFKEGSTPFENITAETARTIATVSVKGTGVGILTAQTTPTFIELEPKKFQSYLKHENLTNATRWRQSHGEDGKSGRERYSKYVKSMIQVEKGDSYFSEHTGLTIEIIPEANPYSLKHGDMLPVQVLFRGAPAIDVAVESAWLEKGKAKMAVFGRTDATGRIKIPIKALGPHRLHAIVMERCAEPQVADWESFWASLTFEIQK